MKAKMTRKQPTLVAGRKPNVRSSMKTLIAKLLTGLSVLLTLGATAQAQYIWTTFNDPLAGHGAGPDTLANNFSGSNIVGGYGHYFSSGLVHGFLLKGTNWTTLNDPLAGPGANQGTYATGMSGTNIVGWYVDGSSIYHGFLYNGSSWTTLDAPQAELSPSGG